VLYVRFETQGFEGLMGLMHHQIETIPFGLLVTPGQKASISPSQGLSSDKMPLPLRQAK